MIGNFRKMVYPMNPFEKQKEVLESLLVVQ